ncbi:MAG: endonuclease domain-containing protein [Bauldia sp.]
MPMDRFKRAASLRANSTRAEARLWRLLRNRNLDRWKFRRQHPIDRYVVDFVTLEGRLIVEIDGATHSLPSEIRYDETRTRYLEALGYRVLRVTNTDVYENIEGVADRIFAELSLPRKQPRRRRNPLTRLDPPCGSIRPLPTGER